MREAGFLAAMVTTLVGAAFAVLSGSVVARTRALPVTVLGIAATVAATGADVVAWAALATGLALGLLFTTGQDPWALAARPRGDRRVVPGAVAAFAFANLYLVAARGPWPSAPREEPVALTALVGARLLTGDLGALAAAVFLLAGAIAGAARIGGRDDAPEGRQRP